MASTILFPSSIVLSINVLATTIKHTSSFLQILYLFTKNDLVTFAFPTTLFALFAALSGTLLTTNCSPTLLSTLSRTPLALLMTWANLLVFDISNQRSPAAIAEDAINKPHRPLPSGRITIDETRRLLLLLAPIVLAISWIMGCWQETLLLFTMTWMYNDLGGCDEDWVLRNFLIACGYGLYSSAALRVMVDSEHTTNPMGYCWIVFITLVMFITQHICDIKDAEGDRTRGRRSAPIVLGDDLVRWTVAIPTIMCSIAAPMFFGLGVLSYISTLVIGGLVAGRTLLYRDLVSDKTTWKIWALWTCWLFVLPLIKSPEVVVGVWDEVLEMLCPGRQCMGGLNLLAVGSVAMVVKGRKLYGMTGADLQGNSSMIVPKIVIEGVIL